MASRRRTVKRIASFEDEDAVLEEVAKAVDRDPEDLEIEEDTGLSSFGAGKVYLISAGRTEWQVVESEDDEYKLAVAVVTQDLEQEPELFSKDFLEQHIDEDRLRQELMSDVENMRIEDLEDVADRDPADFWDQYERAGFDAPAEDEEDDDGEPPAPSHREIEELAEYQAKEQLGDPMAYLEDIYGSREDAVKEAIRIAGIDVGAAAEEAVDTDGAAHFLARYDGRSHVTSPSRFVYWRSN